MTYVGEVHETANGFEWRIENFCSLLEEPDDYYSPHFSYKGNSWYFSIDGDSLENTFGCIDLCICIYLIKSPVTVEYSLALKTVNGENVLDRHFTETFPQLSVSPYLWYISIYEIIRRKAELVPSGVLTVVCTFKTSQSSESASSIATADCSHCKEAFKADAISSHEKKCRVKCPECFEVVLLKNWQEHECPISKVEDDRPLWEDFRKVLLNGLNYDLILKVGDKELRAHQDILRARSQVFESMLSHDMQEKNSGVIDIPDCDAHAMEQFLCYIYTGKVDTLEENNMLKLYYIADKYNMKGLKEKCRVFIKKSLSITNVCDVIQLALNHTDSAVLEYATEYFMNNVLQIMRTVEWQTFMKDNLTAANELTIKTIEQLKNGKI